MTIASAMILGLLLVAIPAQAEADGELQVAEMGLCPLESGEAIRDCRLGYRVYGRLAPDKANAVLFPTWFSGTSEDLQDFIGPEKLIDSSRYFVIVVDAFGNGVSSSPSNSKAQPGPTFPRFTIQDMVNAEYQLVTRVLGIPRLHAVIGLSMGGMQAFQWIVSYPEMVQKAISIIGSPRVTSYDLLLWQTELRAIELAAAYAGDGHKALPVVAGIHTLALATPSYRVRRTPVHEFKAFLTTAEDQVARRFRAEDWASQIRALMSLDISKSFGGSLAQAAAAVKAQVLVVVAEEDHMVYPSPSLEFAKLLRTDPVVLTGDCGHLGFLECGRDRLVAAVTGFMSR